MQAVSRLDRYLTKDGANGRAWKRYLLWDDLQRALGPSDDLERRRIEAVYDRFRAGHRGLELAVFRDVALALRVYFDETSPPIDALPALARSAKEHFIARTPADLARAKRPLVQALGRLDRYLSPAGANGRAWKRFLMWDNLQRELAAQGGPDYVALDAVYHRFHSDHVGLELPVFRDVAQTLWAYRHLAEQVSNAGFHAEFEAHLEMLAKGLADYRQDAEAPLESIGEALGWLQRHRQALDVVRAIRAHLSQPNLYAQVSQGLIAAGSGRTVDETAPVRDFILGTSISGTGRTVGTASLRLVPDPHRAVIETVLDATNHSRTVGHNGPAIIFSAGETRITGCKRLVIDADGARGAPAKSSARTRTRVTGVGSTKRRLMGRIVRRVAQKRIPSQKSAGEQIAARHAEGTFNARLEAEVGATLSNANQTFQQRFRNPLVRRGEFPRLLRFSTTEDALRVEGLHDGPARLAAPSPPPDVSGRPDLALRLHESLVNNFATGLLAGRTIDKDQAERIALDIAGALPPQLQDDAGREPWAIEFAGPQPISLRIEKDRVTLTIRGRRFKSDRRVFDYPMNSTVGYRLENAGGAVKAVREGEVEVFPPDFVPGQGGQLSLRQSTLRNLLKRRFDKIFTPEIVSQGLVFPGRMRRAGKLDLTQLQADRGWLTLAWRRRATNHEAPK
ncbi:MAG TPA: hypothetical protein VMV69_04505 [Pirellulales bacterium]|nr:hypothetical protein [Pirellulales bacterium]